MATTLEELVFKFEADLSGLRADLQRANTQIAGLAKTTETTGKRMQSALGSVGRLFKLDLVIRYGQQLLQLEDQMEQLASQIRDTADRADIGVEALQRLRHAADQNGTSAEALDSALIRLNKAIGLARIGAENMGENFAALGLDELIKKGADTETVFYGVAQAVSKMSDEAQASSIVAAIMGREADRLIELMKNGAPEVKRLGDELKRVISEDTVNRLDEARDKTEEFRKIVHSFVADASSFAIALGAGVVGALKEMFEWIEKNTGAMTALAEVWNSMVNFNRGKLAESFGVPQPATQTAKPRSSFDPSSVAGVTPNEAAIARLRGGGAGGTSEAEKQTERYRDAVADLIFELNQLSRSEAEAAFQEEYRNRLVSAGIPLYGKLTDAQEAHKEAIKELVSQLMSARTATEMLAKAQEVDLANATRAAREAYEELKRSAEDWEQIGATIEDAIAGAFVEMAANMEDARQILGKLIEEIGFLIAKALILKAIEGVVGSIFPGTGSIGGKALGGQVNPGNRYIVGESGPELFVPRVQGQIVPNNRFDGAMGGIVINAPLTAAPGVDRATMEMLLAQHRADLLRIIPKHIEGKWRSGGIRFN